MCVAQGLSESPDLEFEYADTDKWATELSGVWGVVMLCHHGHFLTSLVLFSEFGTYNVYGVFIIYLVCVYQYVFMCVTELYSYTEGPEFALNRKCFEEEFRAHGMKLIKS